MGLGDGLGDEDGDDDDELSMKGNLHSVFFKCSWRVRDLLHSLARSQNVGTGVEATTCVLWEGCSNQEAFTACCGAGSLGKVSFF
jgi:hypothetical protein